MTKYREILRLKSMDFSERNIALSVPCSRNTVSKVLKRAEELKVSWPLLPDQTDAVLDGLLFPKAGQQHTKRMPDYAYIRKELLRDGVSKKLFWTEYMEDCRQSGEEPLMYSQFCYYITSNRMSRNGVPPCISTAHPENRSKLTGRVLRRMSLILTRVKSRMPIYL